MESVLLGDVVRVVQRAVQPEPGTTYRQAGVRLWGVGAYEREPIDGGDTSYKHFYQIREGDLIVNKIWARNGSVAVVPPELDGCYVSGEFPTFEADRSRVSPDWLRWIAKSSLLWDQFDEQSHGTSGKNRIQPRKVLAARIPLPPLDQQARRAERVGHLSALAAQTSRRFADQTAGLGVLRQRILDDAVRGRLTERDPGDEPAEALLKRIASEKQRRFKAGETRKSKALPPVGADEAPFAVPPSWAWTRMNDLFDIRGGIQKTPRRTPVSNPHPYVGVANVQRNALDLREVKEFELFEGELEKWRLAAGDLLIVEGNGSENEIGRCALWNGEIADCVHQNHLIRCRPPASESRAALSRYVALCLNSPHGIVEMKKRAVTTSGLYNLSVGKIQTILIPLAPAAEQRRIVERVGALMALCDQLEARLGAAMEDAGRLAQAVLAEALAGAQTVT